MKKVEIPEEDALIADIIRKYRDEALTNAIRAFNEGYFLGKQHAEKIYNYKKGDNENRG